MFDPIKYEVELRHWLSDWMHSQDQFQIHGWKTAFERLITMREGYIYKLKNGKVDFDINNLVKLANGMYKKPSDILKEIESRLKK